MKNAFIFRFFRDIDIFGKEPQFYYKKNEKKKSNIGSIFTIVYVIIYTFILVYKLNRLIKKKDGIFTDSNKNPENPESIQLTNENFYLGFGIEDPITYDPILDETIYYGKAYFKKASRKGQNWVWEEREIGIEPCKLEKFGTKYREIFSKKYLESYYCFTEMDYIMEGHFSYDTYSLLYISLFPCINTTENGNHCKPIEVIDHYLKGTFVTLQMQDILLTPEDYNNPIKERDQDIYTTVGKKLFKEFHVYFKITNIETNTDIIGIDEIKTVRQQKFIKYDSFSQMTKLLETDIYETGESFCDITLKLSDLVFYQKRNYSNILGILGELGGLMEIIMTIFKVFLSFYIETLYNTAIVNKLFDFEIENQKVVFNENKVLEKIKRKENEEKKKQKKKQKGEIARNNMIQNINNIDMDINTFEELKLSNNSNNKIANHKKKNKNIQNIKANINRAKNNQSSSSRNINRYLLFSVVTNSQSTEDKNENRGLNKENHKNNNDPPFCEKENENEKEDVKKISKVNSIKYNKICFYFCFICYTKRKTNETQLLEEGMNIIKENLDIINIFKKIYKKEKIVRNFTNRESRKSLSIYIKKDEESPSSNNNVT